MTEIDPEALEADILKRLEGDEELVGLSVDDLASAMSPRLDLIARGGEVVYKGGMGPMFFRPKEWEQAIMAHLRRP